MEGKSYWLDLFTGLTWNEFISHGAAISGFRESRWSTVKKIKVGDILLCYLTGVSRFIGALEKPGKSSINIIPAMGWNFYNGYMAELILHNGIVPPKRFTYQLMPLYGFHNNDFAGSGKVASCNYSI